MSAESRAALPLIANEMPFPAATMATVVGKLSVSQTTFGRKASAAHDAISLS